MNTKITLLLLCLISLPLVHFGQDKPSESQPADSANIKAKPKSIHIIDINFEIERTRKRLFKMARDLDAKPEFTQMDSWVSEQKVYIDKETKEFKQFNPHNLSKYFLENTYRAWTGHKNRLLNWLSLVNDQLTKTMNNLVALDFDQKTWQLTIENEQAANDPEQLTKKIKELIRDIEKLQLQFAKQRNEIIVREDGISDIVQKIDDILDEVSQLQQHQRDNLFEANKPRLWNTTFDKSEFFPVLPRLKKAWHENAKTVGNFLKEINFLYLILIIVSIVLLFFLIKKGFSKLDLSEEDPNFVVVKRVFSDHPYAAIVSLAVTILLLFYTTLPLILTGLLGCLLLLSALIYLPGMIGNQGRLIVLVILTLYAINFSEVLAWYFGNYARFYIAFEALLALFLTYKYGLQGFKPISEGAAPFVKVVWWLSVLLFVLFVVALFSNMFGYMNLAVLALKLGVKTAAIVVIVFGAHAILRAMVLAAIEIGRHSKSKVMHNHWDSIEKRSMQLICLLAIIFLIKFILQNIEVYRPVMDWIMDFLSHQWEIGTLHISVGGVFSLILILVISFGLANFFKVIVEDEFLVRANLPKGVPAAISVTVRYFIIILGLTMALSAAGIDLGSFGLIAGALGVGIGFGLQNIVNNFISGLILVYERPVNVGDTVEVENLMGIVKRVGVRSSNVRTFDGAEVVVPNGNLISNQLINWTLSDNQRRVEVKVGAAYGSDPNLVLDLLKKVAVEHVDVLKDPEPRALFDGFGDSSLDFRLLFWVHFEMGIGTKSDIAIGIYNVFAKNDIQIPFPQIDLHVKKEELETSDTKTIKKKSKGKTKENPKTAKKKSSEAGPIEEPELKPPD